MSEHSQDEQMLKTKLRQCTSFRNFVSYNQIWTGSTIDVIWMNTKKAYSWKQEHECDFSEKDQKKGNKGQNIWKFGQKCTKIENILKKGRIE